MQSKCEPYLPPRSGQYGGIHVDVQACRPANGYYVRDIVLTHMVDGTQRHIKHFWFTSWPDQAAPFDSARQLVDMCTAVQSHKNSERARLGLCNVGPIAVHCSAGIGRTGCFIAVCIGGRQLDEEHMVDVLATVCQMRLDRGGMIQTPEQYEFIHRALAIYEQRLIDSPLQPY